MVHGFVQAAGFIMVTLLLFASPSVRSSFHRVPINGPFTNALGPFEFLYFLRFNTKDVAGRTFCDEQGPARQKHIR
jgi:hypothetical protein